ncbi:MAG: NADH-quinone oxidoreductase subunit J [Anaerolineaceae bacterium]
MSLLFIVSGAVAIIATVLVITRLNAVHALLYMIVSLLAVAFIFFLLGAPFVAALEVIVYAGAIMVLFVFVIMTLNLGPQSVDQERRWLDLRGMPGVAILTVILLGELIFVLSGGSGEAAFGTQVSPQEFSISLFGPYLLGVELASILLLAALVGAYHLGRNLK